jgi:pyruvate dehydrogenase E1 component
MFYKESKNGQVLQEGINEAGAMSDWIAAGTVFVHGVQMIPFYICYSMFGMQRTMDLCWAAGDQRARGFLIGGTAGRTTLNGEGLQHEDGHSADPLQPDPELHQLRPDLPVRSRRGRAGRHAPHVQEQEDVFYYLTVMNENYEHPEMPVGAEADILKGMYQFRKGAASNGPRVQLLGSGTIFREVIAAADLLKNDWGVEADLWGCPSFNELARNGQDVPALEPAAPDREATVSHVELPAWRKPAARSLRPPTTSRLRRADPSFRPRAYGARHRRLRPLRHARKAAPFLRGRPLLDHARRTYRAG